MKENIMALLVDDDPDVLAAVGDMLETEGLRVLRAPDALSGLSAALAGRPDVIVLDVRMPRVDGFELALMLRTDGVAAPIILITAQNAFDFRGWKEMDEAGIARVLFKPFARAALMDCIRTVIKESRIPRTGRAVDQGIPRSRPT